MALETHPQARVYWTQPMQCGQEPKPVGLFGLQVNARSVPRLGKGKEHGDGEEWNLVHRQVYHHVYNMCTDMSRGRCIGMHMDEYRHMHGDKCRRVNRDEYMHVYR